MSVCQSVYSGAIILKGDVFHPLILRFPSAIPSLYNLFPKDYVIRIRQVCPVLPFRGVGGLGH